MNYYQSLLKLCSYLGCIFLFSCQPQSTSDTRNVSEADLHKVEHALYGIEVAKGLEMSLFASEPMLINPTNIDVDDRGRVWVCEAVNYRMQHNPDNPTRAEGDRIVILEDTNGDGKADQSKVFYQGTDINSALGICVLGNKVYVSASPNVYVFTDTNGDDIPDTKDSLFTSISGKQDDHGMHALTFGPDGRLYFNHGNAGKQLKNKNGKPYTDWKGREINNSGKPYRQGMVYRSEMDGSKLEVLGHNFRNIYEPAVDSYGTLWQSDNDDDGNRGVRINYVMEHGNYGYTDEMTGAGWNARRTGMETEIPFRHWHLNDPGVVPNLLQTGAGSPAGIAVYEGDLLPETYRNRLIHCDPGPNLLRAYPVTVAGAGYTAEAINLFQGKENLWVRPIDVCVAPDGSLIVADWYDPGVGGHKVGDLEHGRIYRLAPPKSKYKFDTPNYSTAQGAVKALQSPNQATRFKAWMALNEMKEGARSALEKLWTNDNPRFKARALWLLARLDFRYIETALKDKDPDLRITALRALRQLYPDRLPSTLAVLAGDASAQVRREVALALHTLEGEKPAQIWAKLASQYDGQDRWYLEALGIGSDNNADRCMEVWLAQDPEAWKSPAGRDLVWRVRSSLCIGYLKDLILDSATPQQQKVRLFRALDFHRDTAAREEALLAILEASHPAQTEIRNIALTHISPEAEKKYPLVRKVLRQSLDEIVGTENYLDIVKRFKLDNQSGNLMDMVLSVGEDQLRADATRLLLSFGEEKRLRKVLENKRASFQEKSAVFDALSLANTGVALDLIQAQIFDADPSDRLRKQAIQALSRGWSGEHRLLDLLKKDQIPDSLEALAANSLMSAIDGSVRIAAMKYLNMGKAQEGMPDIQVMLGKKGDPLSGENVFEQWCANCHMVNGAGVKFGPELSLVGDKLSKEALYAAILQPSAGINFGYQGYLLTMKDGSVLSGYIESETRETITLRMVGGLAQPVLKKDIRNNTAMEQSLMPEGLHIGIKEQELVDLVAYLSSLKSPDMVQLR